MIFVDEMKKSWKVLMNKSMDDSKSLKESLIFFYKATFIPFIITLLVSALTLSQLSSSLNSTEGMATLASMSPVLSSLLSNLGWISLVFSIASWLFITPLVVFVFAAIVQWIGKALCKFNGTRVITFNAMMRILSANYLLSVVLSALSLIIIATNPAVLNPVLAASAGAGSLIGAAILGVITSIISFIFLIWIVILSIIWLAKKQKVSGVQSFISLLLGSIVIGIILFIISLIIAGIFVGSALTSSGTMLTNVS